MTSSIEGAIAKESTVKTSDNQNVGELTGRKVSIFSKVKNWTQENAGWIALGVAITVFIITFSFVGIDASFAAKLLQDPRLLTPKFSFMVTTVKSGIALMMSALSACLTCEIFMSEEEKAKMQIRSSERDEDTTYDGGRALAAWDRAHGFD